MLDCIVVGSGFAGGVIARELAERANKKVLVIEKRDHIGGNMFDYVNKNGVLVHKYGPHIFHTSSELVYEYLSRFTNWIDYEHEVLAEIDGMLVPVPFNLNTLNTIFDQNIVDTLKDALISKYGMETKVPILKLKEDIDPLIRELADFVYNKIFINYTIKQWGLKPEEIDPSVTARVPVFISYDNRYFQDKYQGMPSQGYTSLFNKLLDHPNITIRLNTNSLDVLSVDTEGGNIYFDGNLFNGIVIYTGQIEELLKGRFGLLPYRSLDFKFETYYKEYFQPVGTVNYPNSKLYTRITEFKHMTGQKMHKKTTIVKEYPADYDEKIGNIPFYPIITDYNTEIYNKYTETLSKVKNLYLLGRLAEYKYYNMDAIVQKALELFEKVSK